MFIKDAAMPIFFTDINKLIFMIYLFRIDVTVDVVSHHFPDVGLLDNVCARFL